MECSQLRCQFAVFICEMWGCPKVPPLYRAESACAPLTVQSTLTKLTVGLPIFPYLLVIPPNGTGGT